MFDQFIKLKMDEEYAIANPNKDLPFVILGGGGTLIYDELEKESEETFVFEEFCEKFSSKYNVDLEIIKEDVREVLKALEFDEEEEEADKTLRENRGLEPYTYVFDYFNKRDKVFKVFMELTYACNLKCKHCYVGTDINSKKTRITLENAKRILEELKEAGVIDITFTGGELFCHPNALEIIEYACEKKFLVTVLTNGTFVTGEIATRLAELPISQVRISLYGTRKFHDEFVGVNGAFDKSLSALKFLNNKKKNFCMANSVITRNSVDSLLQLKQFLNDLGIGHRLTPVIYPTAKGDMGPTKLRISEDEIVSLIRQGILNYAGSQCNSGIARLRITPFGEINPCELFRNVSFGNILEKSFKEIVESDERKEWIRNIRKKLKESECASCLNNKYCPKCLGVMYLENGDVTKKSEGLCMVARAKARSVEDEIK